MLKLMAANWKMYKDNPEALETADELFALLHDMPRDREVVIFTSATNLGSLAVASAKVLSQNLPVAVGAQNFYPAEEGAYTGEVSLNMIKYYDATWVLVGHSERRALFHEDNAFLAKKAKFALEHDFSVVFCIGETLEEREAGKLTHVLEEQIKLGLAEIPAQYEPSRLAIAYEPVWAIGTGKVAQEADIAEAHALIRKLLHTYIGEKANETRILYGGSVKPENSQAIMAIENVDGVLVGGASLKADSFNKIVRS